MKFPPVAHHVPYILLPASYHFPRMLLPVHRSRLSLCFCFFHPSFPSPSSYFPLKPALLQLYASVSGSRHSLMHQWTDLFLHILSPSLYMEDRPALSSPTQKVPLLSQEPTFSGNIGQLPFLKSDCSKVLP